MRIVPIHGDFVAEVSEVDLSAPLPASAVAQVHEGIDRFAVLIFRGQDLDGEQHLAFTRQLGPIQPAVGNNVTQPADRRLGVDFSDVSNLDRDGRILPRADRGRLFGLGNRLWHSDASFRAVPAKYSLLHCRSVVSRGGTTEFADMRAAWDALDAGTRAEIGDLVAEHSQLHSRGLLGFAGYSAEERAAFAPVWHRMVRRNERTGREALYLGAHAGTILGWPMPEARAFIFDLMEHATRRAFVHVHDWRLHDLVIWDNRQVMHRVRPYDDTREVRDMRRTTIMGDGPTVDQAVCARAAASPA